MSATPDEIAAARAYEGLHVPSLFRQWAPVVLDALEFREGQSLLDVACGTGILAREARERCGDACSISGLDADAGMLAVAESLDASIDWRQGLAESLPFEDDAFDAVACQFGLMFLRDRLEAIRQMLRVLAPGGRLAVAVWDSLDNSEAYPLEVDLLERRAGPEAADALRAPFVLGDKAALSALFSEAGADKVDVRTRYGTARFPNIRTMVEADLTGWLPVMGVNLPNDLVENILADAEDILADYVTSSGSVEFIAPAHIVTASATQAKSAAKRR